MMYGLESVPLTKRQEECPGWTGLEMSISAELSNLETKLEKQN